MFFHEQRRIFMIFDEDLMAVADKAVELAEGLGVDEVPQGMRRLAKASKLIRWAVNDQNGFLGKLGLLLNSPLQEYLNQCFKTSKLQTKLFDFISMLVDEEVTDDELARMNDLLGQCNRGKRQVHRRHARG